MWSCSLPSRHLSHPSCGLWLNTITQLAARDESSSCFRCESEALWPCQHGCGDILTTEAFLFTCKHIFLWSLKKTKTTGAFRKTTLCHTRLQETRIPFLWCLLCKAISSCEFYLVFGLFFFYIICWLESKISQILVNLQISVSWLATFFFLAV